MKERLSKTLAGLGIASRRGADQLVREGRVTVNGAVVTEPGFPVDVTRDKIKVDGKAVRSPTPVHLVVNKPRGVLSTPSDPLGRPTVLERLRGVRRLLVPIARLEVDEEGVMVLTSDRALAHALNAPRAGIPRTYLMKVRGIPDQRTLMKLRLGVPLQGGRTLPMEVRLISVTGRNAWLRVTVREVRHRLLRHAMMKLRHPVTKLKRVQFGPIPVKGLAPGTFRKLTAEELDALRALAESPPGLPEPLSEEQVREALADAPPRGVSERPHRKRTRVARRRSPGTSRRRSSR